MVSLVSAMELLGDRQPQGWATLALLGLARLHAVRSAPFPPGGVADGASRCATGAHLSGDDVRRLAFPRLHQRRPFLLPLLFQVGFGMDPFHSGLLVLAVFVGNLTIKPATTPLIRWLGFRRLLLINGR
jgi:hypothetical protein